jgi:hypothetical protein
MNGRSGRIDARTEAPWRGLDCLRGKRADYGGRRGRGDRRRRRTDHRRRMNRWNGSPWSRSPAPAPRNVRACADAWNAVLLSGDRTRHDPNHEKEGWNASTHDAKLDPVKFVPRLAR